MSFNWERTAIAGSPIAAVVPVYRDGGTVSGLIEALAHELQSLDRPFEILLVDDASTDDSQARLDDLAKRFPQVRVLRHEKHEGQGAALRTGIQAAQHPLILTIPADGSYPPVVLHQLLGHIDEVDIVLGVRREASWWQRFADAWRGKMFLGLRVRDPACPLRLYRKSVFDRLPIQSNSAFAHQEILAKATFLECIMAEADVNWDAKPSVSDEPSTGKDFRTVFRSPAFGNAASTEAGPQPSPA